MIVQYYKSQLKVGTALFPVPPGGATLNWTKAHQIPYMAGNFWQINYIEGFQAPSVNSQIVLLDGTSANCPLYATTMNSWWMTRSADYQHDISAITSGLRFFDGFSGFQFADCKANSFTISGSKGDDVRFTAAFMLYDATNGGADVPVLITTPPDNTYPYFQGQPIRFQSCTFQKKAAGDLTTLQGASGNDWDGVMQWSVSFSNNMSADMSMKGNSAGAWPYQSPLPVDCNAGQMTATANFVLQANPSTGTYNHIAVGDAINIRIKQGSINTSIGMQVAVCDTQNVRSIGGGRQMRSYSCTLVGADNTKPPLTIAAGF